MENIVFEALKCWRRGGSQNPNRLTSPDTLLKRRHGNCYEMATLLCSLLIGNRYAAMVVSGYASREITNNDQQRVACPNIPLRFDFVTKQESVNETKPMDESKNKYELREPIDLRSKFLLDVEVQKLKKADDEKQREIDQKMEELKILEKLPDDELHGFRRHAWIVILSNVDWAAKKSADSTHGLENKIEAFFIEPATGAHFQVDDPNYYAIDSVWNERNYYVNLQDSAESDISTLKWDLQDVENWAIFVNDETVINFVKRSETPDELRSANINFCAKYLDMPNSWVNPFSVTNADFDERYPGGSKKIHYKRSLLELFAPYLNNDGLVKRITVYKNLDYTDETVLWQWYQNRDDLLVAMEKDFESKKIIEVYENGRLDALFTRSNKRDGEKLFEFGENSRLDGLLKLEVKVDSIHETFEQRRDRFLLWREFSMDKKNNKKLTRIVERFHRNESVPFHENILHRIFDIADNKIILQFHYGENDITPIIRTYVCPPKPDFGCEIVFNETENPVDETNRYERNVPKLKRYYTLLEQLRDQETCIKEFEQRLLHIESTLVEHQNNAEHPILKFTLFDPLRNSIARSRRLAENDRIEREKVLAMTSAPDSLAPYLVHFTTKPNAIESLQIFERCLNDIRTDYAGRLNHLKQRLEHVCNESESLKRFLLIVRDDLDPADYEHFIKQGHELDVSKRVLQQRIADVEIEFEEKYQQTKDQLANDCRLTTHEIHRLEGKPNI